MSFIERIKLYRLDVNAGYVHYSRVFNPFKVLYHFLFGWNAEKAYRYYAERGQLPQ